MSVAQQRNCTNIVELERAFFVLRPRAHVVAKLLVATNRNPENIVRSAVSIQKVYCAALLYRENVGLEHQVPLRHDRMLRGGWKTFPSYRFDINDGRSLDSRDLAAERRRSRCQAQSHSEQHY